MPEELNLNLNLRYQHLSKIVSQVINFETYSSINEIELSRLKYMKKDMNK